MSVVLPSLRAVTPQRRAVLSSRARLLRLLSQRQRVLYLLTPRHLRSKNQAVVIDCRDLHPSKPHA